MVGFCREQSWYFPCGSFAEGLCSTSAQRWHQTLSWRAPSSLAAEQWCPAHGTSLGTARTQAAGSNPLENSSITSGGETGSPPGLQSTDPQPGAPAPLPLPGVCWKRGAVPCVRRGHPAWSHTDSLVSLPPPSAFVLQDAALTKASTPLGQYRLLFIPADLIRSARLGYKALIYWST